MYTAQNILAVSRGNIKYKRIAYSYILEQQSNSVLFLESIIPVHKNNVELLHSKR